MIESFSAALYTNNKDTKTYPNCPLYPHRVELANKTRAPLPQGEGCNNCRGTAEPQVQETDGGRRSLAWDGQGGLHPSWLQAPRLSQVLEAPHRVWGKMGNPQDKPVSSFWGPIWICPFLLFGFKENQKCKDLKCSMNFISGST